jgi:hypothetical protein
MSQRVHGNRKRLRVVKQRTDTNIPQDNAREHLAMLRIPFRGISYLHIPQIRTHGRHNEKVTATGGCLCGALLSRHSETKVWRGL